MERVLTRQNSVQLILLELLSLTPILIILGNIVPPIPMKIHHIGFGLIFLIVIYALMLDQYKKWVLYFALGFLFIQFTHEQWYLKGYIDYFFGPFVFIFLLDLHINKRLPIKTLEKYIVRFFAILWIPIIIAMLQFMNIFPITFWNATYVNFAYFGDVAIPRPNGFLYHGSELSVIICFAALYQYFKGVKVAFWMLLLICIAAMMTYFKALFGCVVILFIYYIFFVSNGIGTKIKLMTRKRLWLYSISILCVVGIYIYQYLMMIHSYTGYYFTPTLLTGRGAIWNIYLERIKEFTWWNYFIGNGMGTSFDIFADYATPETWYLLAIDPNTDTDYDTHNAILSVFINSGIIGVLFIVYIFKMVYNQAIRWLPNPKWNKAVFFGIFILPLLTIGVTIPIYENSIFWIATGFLIMRWNYFTNQNETANQL